MDDPRPMAWRARDLSEPISLLEAYFRMSEGAATMIKHVYECPECEQVFSVHHPDERVYPDSCPNCCYSMPLVVDMVEEDDDE